MAPIWMIRPTVGNSLALTGDYDNLLWLALISHLKSRELDLKLSSAALPVPPPEAPPAALVIDALNRTAAQTCNYLSAFRAAWPDVPVYLTGRAGYEVAHAVPVQWAVRHATEDELATSLSGSGVMTGTDGTLPSRPDCLSQSQRGWWRSTTPPRQGVRCGSSGVIEVEASRGCRFNCAFCSVDMTERGRVRNWVPRDPEAVVNEIADLVDRTGLDRVQFMDDNFLGSPTEAVSWVREFCDQVTHADLKISFSIYARFDRTLLSCLGQLLAAGLRQVHGGVESGSDSVLTRLRKGTTSSELARVISVLRQEEVDVIASLITFESRSTVRELAETLQWLRSMGLQRFFSATTALPYRGTVLAREIAAESGRDAGFLAADGTPGLFAPYFRHRDVAAAYSSALAWEREHEGELGPSLEEMMRHRFRYEASLGFLDQPADPVIAALTAFRSRQINYLLAEVNECCPA